MIFSKLVGSVLGLPRIAKRTVALLVDASLCVFAVWLAYYLRLGEFVVLTGNALIAAVASVAIALPIFIISGLYRAIFRYSGLPALVSVARAVTFYGLVYATLFTAVGFPEVPRTIGIIQPIILLLLVGASRSFARLWLGSQYQNILRKVSRPKILIYGAGRSGRELAAAMSNSHEMQVVGFLDDDSSVRGRVLNGQRIYSPKDLKNLVETLHISMVLLAIPSIGRQRRNEILGQIRDAQVSVRTLPSVTDLAQGRVSVTDLRELDIDDLLGREPVAPDEQLLAQTIRDKVVLVTGAGGSIGSELCRQIIAVKPAVLLLIEQSEFALYAIHQELQDRENDTKTVLIPLLASVQDKDRINEIMDVWRPVTVFHAAAYKHVPLVEHNPSEGIKNNVFGTLYVAQAAAASGVKDFVLISSDKAVRPTNIMGASKRLAEMGLQAMAAMQSSTKFSMVRFGNVLDSSGSVVPKFRQQIREGRAITLTHPEVTRYFMTIPEAAQLVIQAGAMAQGGDVFVLNMGESVKIIDLARRMIELSGLTVRDEKNPEGDIPIEITGLRPGEKLFEELLIGNNPLPTNHQRIMRAEDECMSWSELNKNLEDLEQVLLKKDVVALRMLLEQMVPSFKPDGGIVDWVYLEKSHPYTLSKKTERTI